MKTLTTFYDNIDNQIQRQISYHRKPWESPVIPYSRAKESPANRRLLPACTTLLKEMRDVPLLHLGEYTKAWYNPLTDRIYMPMPEQFRNTEDCYMTLFHEIIHSTGHTSRLARPSLSQYHRYRHYELYEEVVAEIGSIYLCAKASILQATLANQIDYLAPRYQKWQRIRRRYPNIASPFTAAQSACDWLLTPPDPILYPPCQEPREPYYPEP